MCDPTLAMSALSVGKSMSAISDQNAAAARNREIAIQAQNDQIDDQGRQYVEQNRSLIQGTFDSILAGREAEADAYTSAIANGAQGNSVRAMMSATRQKVSRGATRSQQEGDSLRGQVGASFKNIRSRTQGRINSVPTTSFGIGDAAQALAPIVRHEME